MIYLGFFIAFSRLSLASLSQTAVLRARLIGKMSRCGVFFEKNIDENGVLW